MTNNPPCETQGLSRECFRWKRAVRWCLSSWGRLQGSLWRGPAYCTAQHQASREGTGAEITKDLTNQQFYFLSYLVMIWLPTVYKNDHNRLTFGGLSTEVGGGDRYLQLCNKKKSVGG